MGKMEQERMQILPAMAGSASWRIVNDDVMGGISESRMVRAPGAVGVFTGRVSLDHGGGFASARVDVDGGDWAGREGLEIEVTGDGKQYQLHLRNSPGPGGVSYRARFQTRGGTRTTLRLPFSSFLPTYRGRELPDEVPLDPSRIRQLGFLIAEGQEGEFRLEVFRASVYGTMHP